MKILITGGLGFVGSHLVYELGQKHKVDIIDGFDRNYVGFKYIHRGQGLNKLTRLKSIIEK